MPSLPEWSDPDKRDEALMRAAVRLAQADPLSKGEVAILFLLSHGVPNRLIAEWLHLAHSTVVSNVKHARRKLFAETTAHAVATALRMGLFS